MCGNIHVILLAETASTTTLTSTPARTVPITPASANSGESFALWSKRRKVKTATGQNGDTEMATEMDIFKTVTNPNNTYSSSEAYIIDRMLYTYMLCNC